MTKPEEIFNRLLHGRTLEQVKITFKTEHDKDGFSDRYTVIDKKSGEKLFSVIDIYTDWYCRGMSGGYYFHDYVDEYWCQAIWHYSPWAQEIFYKVDKIYKKSLKIIKCTTNINAQDNYGNIPLIEAVETGNVEIVESLIKKGANLDLTNKKGDTALLVAIKQGFTETAELLIENGANLYLQDKEGNTPLTLAIKNFKSKIANLIAQKIEQNNKKLREEVKELKAKIKTQEAAKPSVNGGKVLKKIMAEKKKVISDWYDNWSNAWH